MTIMTQFRWFWAWEDDKEEIWLREMAQKGWHFKSVSLPGNYVFEQGEPRDDVYRLDHFTNAKDKTNYLQLFIDAGWEYMGEMNSWQYFRKTAIDGDAPEIFSDNESKAKKYRKLMIFLAVFMLVFGTFTYDFYQEPGVFFGGLKLVIFLLMMFYVYAILRLLQRVLALKKKL